MSAVWGSSTNGGRHRPERSPMSHDLQVRDAIARSHWSGRRRADPRSRCARHLRRDAVQGLARLLPLVNSIARGYRTGGLERADLVQEGCVGILRALRRFDPDRGVPSSVYAALWVRQALQELRSDFIRPLRLPPKALRQLARLKSEHYRIYADEHRDASLAELATSTTTTSRRTSFALHPGRTRGRAPDPRRPWRTAARFGSRKRAQRRSGAGVSSSSL